MSDRTPRVALLGAGAWGHNHLRTLHELGALALVCDPDERRLGAVRRTFPGVEVTSDLEQVFSHPDIEGVVVATPAPTHAELALRAIEAGKDVLVEKPLATDIASAAEVVRAAGARGAVLMVGHMLEYQPAMRRLHELLAAGELGAVRWASASRLKLGRVRNEENVLWSFGPHDITLLLGVVGADPEWVTCRGGAYVTPGVEDVGFLGLSFAGGVEAQISVSWLHPFREMRLVVVGEQAMAVIDENQPPERQLTIYPYEVERPEAGPPVAVGGQPTAIPVDGEMPLRAESRHFLERIVDRGRPLTDGPSGLRTLRVLEAGRRSLAQGGIPVAFKDTEVNPGVGAVEGDGYFAHPTATVDHPAAIGGGTSIWHYSHVMSGAVIGRGCSLGQNVFVGNGVRIGDGVKIQNNVSVYDGVTLEDGVFCGPSMVFTNVLNPRAEVERKDEFRPTLVQRGATLGANCTVLCGVTIGEYAFVGAGSVVTADVPPHALVVGVPARCSGWICVCGEQLRDVNQPRCGRCGRGYLRSGESVALADDPAVTRRSNPS
jgi:UDP-2-acetamido-3-amino-2,3-dideoxy-glucuronate N-acetyltransferase